MIRSARTPWRASIGGDVVEVITVVMREHDEVQRWKLGDLHGRFGEPLGVKAQPQVSVLAGVEKIRVSEDGEPGIADQRCRRAGGD